MRILIDTGHPVYIHFYVPIAKRLIEKGHEVKFAIRDKDCSVSIATASNIDFVIKGRGSNIFLLKPFYFFLFIASLSSLARRFKPDLFLSFSSPYAGITSAIFNKPHVAFDDTEGDILAQMLYLPFCSRVITPEFFQKNLGKKHHRVNAFKEQAFLGKFYKESFSEFAPEDYILIRLVKHGAVHDLFFKKWHMSHKLDFVRTLAKEYKVVISSEFELPEDLKAFEFSGPPEKLHNTIARAKMMVGESATVAAEAAILGVPAVFIDYTTRGYLKGLESKYELVKTFKPTKEQLSEVFSHIQQVMEHPVNPKYQQARQRLFEETDDIVDYMVNTTEQYAPPLRRRDA